MNKKLYGLFCLAATLFLTAACTHEEEDLFDDSSAIRAAETIQADMEVLTGASNGWLMEYFPATMQEYGGYNVLLKFGTDGKVEAASEWYGATDVVSSYYSVKQSAGVLLSFDTYNEIFHMFSDPSDPTGIGGKGYGLEGDYDFLILEATPDKVVLKGKASGGTAVMTPIQEEWSQYLTAIQEAEASMSFKKYNLEMNGETIPVSVSYRTLTFTYGEEENEVSTVASYIVTRSGYKFYEPVEINGKTISGFTFDAANQLFTEDNDAGIRLVPVIPPLNEQFVEGNWFIAYSTLGSYAQPYFAYCKTNGIDAEGEELIYAFIGSALYGSFGFNFNSSGYAGLLGLDYELIGEDKVTLVFNYGAAGYGAYYYNYAYFYYMLFPFGYSSPRTFTLTTDNLASPSYVTLTEDANPNNCITLFANQVNYPFRN